jgi:ABC-2 type transport system permease protein
MGRLMASLKDKKLRFGTFSTVMILLAVLMFLLVNLVADQFNVSRDLTRDQMYSLSRHSREFLANLDQDVRLYALFRTGNEHLMLSQILEQYASSSPHIRVENRDPLLYPAFVEQFARPEERIDMNSVIVVSANRHKVIAPSDMFTYEFNMQTFREDILVSIDFEPQITKAIQYVTLDNAPMVYYVTGSEEPPMHPDFIRLLEMENYIFNEVDLVLNAIPDDCDILMLTMPKRDWSGGKADRILEFLQNEGRALFVMGYQSGRFPNMDRVLSAYGVALGDYIVLEGDSNRFYMGSPGFIVPGFIPSDITQPLIDRRFASLFIESTGIDILPLVRSSTTIEPVVVTSRLSYGKNNPEPTTINKEPGDIDGPFNLGVTITDSWYTNRSFMTKLVVFSCLNMLDPSINDIIGGTNWGLVVNSLHWLSDQPVSLFIPAKSPSRVQPLSMTQGEANTVAFISAIAMPLIFVVAGIAVWYRRRHS